jgi:calreticulin
VYGEGGKNPKGSFGLAKGPYAGSSDEGIGLTTMTNGSYYLISAPFFEETTNIGTGKPIFFQYSVTTLRHADCFGQYIKILPKDAFDDQKNFLDSSKYNIMFGPDVCIGKNTEFRIILRNNNKNHEIKKKFIIPRFDDQISHLFTFGLYPNNTFAVWADGIINLTGTLEESFAIIEPKKIPGLKIAKPADWDDRETIPDPDFDPFDEPLYIDDPDDKKPKRWDEKKRGPWEPRKIFNRRSSVIAPLIQNPNFMGKWAPLIDNPNYKPHPELHEYASFMYIGIDVWQITSGTIFDNFFVTDDQEEVKRATQQWKKFSDVEKFRLKNDKMKNDEELQRANVRQVEL